MITNNLQKFLVFGHRGASSIAPENTIKAFEKAIELGADYIEFDVHQSKDGEIVIMHDGNTLRTTGHFGIINKMTLSDLKKLDCGEGEKIPTLEEVIEVTKGKIGLNCEIKERGFAGKIIEILKQSDMIDSTIISSFKHDELLKFQIRDSQIKLASLEPTKTGWIHRWMSKKRMLKRAIKNKFYAVNPFYKLVTKKLVEKAHQNRIKVFPWTVNSKSEIKKIAMMGVDGIITNYVSRAKEVIDQKS